MADSSLLTPDAARAIMLQKLRHEYKTTAAALADQRDQLRAKIAQHSSRATRDHKRILLQLQRTIDWINREAAAFDAEV